MSKRNLFSVVAIAAIIIVVLGCKGLQQRSTSPSVPPNEPRNTAPQQPDQARRDDAPNRQPDDQPLFPNDQQPAAQNPNVAGDNADPSVLYGAWVNDTTVNGLQCHGEYIYESTGTYSTLGNCGNAMGSYMTRSVGTWRLVQPGVVRIEYTDHEPKEFGGQPIRYPTGETVTFSVVNRNEINTSGGTMYREQ